jgi:hypothetical protein
MHKKITMWYMTLRECTTIRVQLIGSFLCALDPSLRQTWADAMSRFAKLSPETTLITLMFPLDDKEGGPPYALSEQIYHDLLDQQWTLVHLGDIPSEWSIKGPRTGDKIGVWKRKCT